MLGIEPAKEERLAASLGGHFAPHSARELDLELGLEPADVGNLALMGPAGHHLDPVALDTIIAALPPLTKVSARFRISVFELLKRPPA
jgi:23S rRNA (guanine745-N1)-methyltransferase